MREIYFAFLMLENSSLKQKQRVQLQPLHHTKHGDKCGYNQDLEELRCGLKEQIEHLEEALNDRDVNLDRWRMRMQQCEVALMRVLFKLNGESQKRNGKRLSGLSREQIEESLEVLTQLLSKVKVLDSRCKEINQRTC